jgi:CheY-like chemotaxis protein
MNVLVIDDDKVSRRVLAKMLLSEGHFVIEASDGALGVRIIADNPHIDCVITDLMMPELDGYGVLSAVADSHPNLPVLVISGRVGTKAIGEVMMRELRWLTNATKSNRAS